MTTPEWLREGALGVAFTALLGVGRGLFRQGKDAKRLEVLEEKVEEIPTLREDVTAIRVQVAEIHGWLKARNGFTPPRSGA